LILRVNPLARRGLALTYSHLFLDEFQDTTQIQYDLVKTIFLASDTVITAVGDNKQQIMRWAMAMEQPFVEYERDFAAKRVSLLNNYRSSPELVRVQHILAQALDERAIAPVSKVEGAISGHSCAVWDFSSPEVEAAILADFIAKEMKAQGLSPPDFVILVRQKATDYVPLLANALGRHDIVLRNEAAEIGPVKLQELLSEDLSELVISLIRLATADRAGRAWGDCLNALSLLRGLAADDDRARTRLGREIETFTAKFRETYPRPVSSESDAEAVVKEVLDFVGRAALVAACPAYSQGDWMKKVEEAVALHLQASSALQPEWRQALDVYEGVDSLPLMTIHKSKGLEYHTVIFVGLDDGAWWSFSRDQVEATAGFFVAFTRAKQRVLFTYCPTRGYRNTIATLYELLQRAGVPVINAG
jgi:superfamily I DNA/RNA helicase